MRSWLRLLLLIVAIVILGSGMVFCAEGGDKVSLQLDGKAIETDVAPIIEKDRTLIPYRALLEAMGADVSWDDKERMATAVLGSQKVQVTIDSTVGFVNGIKKSMDVPPRIINSRTMIPVRFVMENLKCNVDWDSTTRTVLIKSPQEVKLTEITSITLEETKNSYRIKASANNIIDGTRTFAYEKPERYGIDIKNAVYRGGIGKINADNMVLGAVRFSQFNDETVRIVADLNDNVAGKVSLSSDKKTVYIDFEKPEPGDNSEPDKGTIVKPDVSLPEMDWRATGKLIVIDAGHGGSDPGAEGVLNGEHAIWEKELNLPIALRLYDLLKGAGANVSILRKTDKSMSLYSRPESANNMNADLLVSIHNNSCEISKAKGTEVLYYNKNGEADYGFTSRDVASYVQKEMLTTVGLSDRGIKSRPDLAVLKKSIMPAIIIEGGFLSNPDDLKVMLTDKFIENYSKATATGIIKALNAAVKK